MENQAFSNNRQGPKMNKNPKWGSLSFIGAFLFFFFPFFMVECSDRGDQKYRVSGVEVATGGLRNAINESSVKHATWGSGYVKSPTSIWALFALISVLTGAATAIMYDKRAAIVSMCAGLIATISLIALPVDLYFKWYKQIEMNYMHFQFGYFAALGCLVAATYFCYKRYDDIFKKLS